jgi:soluble lytic murein transglycosylase-like protein
VLPLLVLGAVLARFAEEAQLKSEGMTPPVVSAAAGEHSDLREIGSVLAVRAPALAPEVRRRLSRTILEESRRVSLDPLFILALIDVESEFRRDAVSRSGARGLMQLRDATREYLAEKEGVRLSKEEIDRDPSMQVRLGIRYLAHLERRFGSLNLGLMAKAWAEHDID